MSSQAEKAQHIIREAHKLMDMDDPDDLDDDLRGDFNFDVYADMKRRVETLEDKLTGQQTDPQVAAGERVLAKAQETVHRHVTPEGIMERAQKAFSNPVDIGIVSGYLAVGTHEALVKAVDLVGQTEERIERTNADTPLNGLADQFGLGDDTTEQLQGALEALRQDVATLLGRITRLESNQAATHPTQLVAKGFTRADYPQGTPTAAELMTRAQGVIDSPQQIGVLSSLINEGKLADVKQAVEAAERDHDARVKAAERRRLR